MPSSFWLIFLACTVVLVVFIFFGYLLHIKVVEFIHAFELAFSISLGIIFWLKQKLDG